MQILTRPAFDVCVIGSGPAGGFAAKELTEAGATVVLLEAGDEVPPHQFAGHRWPYQFPRRGSFDERQQPFYPDDIGRHIAFEGADRVGVDRIRVAGRAQHPLERRHAAFLGGRLPRGTPRARARLAAVVRRAGAVLQPCRTDHWRVRHARGPAADPRRRVLRSAAQHAVCRAAGPDARRARWASRSSPSARPCSSANHAKAACPVTTAGIACRAARSARSSQRQHPDSRGAAARAG